MRRPEGVANFILVFRAKKSFFPILGGEGGAAPGVVWSNAFLTVEHVLLTKNSVQCNPPPATPDGIDASSRIVSQLPKGPRGFSNFTLRGVYRLFHTKHHLFLYKLVHKIGLASLYETLMNASEFNMRLLPVTECTNMNCTTNHTNYVL